MCDSIHAVLNERARQKHLWGDQTRNTRETWLRILIEEVGEVAKALNEKEWEQYRTELVQVAAVAVAAVESYDAWH